MGASDSPLIERPLRLCAAVLFLSARAGRLRQRRFRPHPIDLRKRRHACLARSRSDRQPRRAVLGLSADRRRASAARSGLSLHRAAARASVLGRRVRRLFPISPPWGQKVVFDRTFYGRRLLGEPTRSATSRYSQLIEDIRDDITRIEQFAPVAARVADLDAKRNASLAYVSHPSPVEAHRRDRADARERADHGDGSRPACSSASHPIAGRSSAS